MKPTYLVLALVWAALIFAASSQPGSAVGLSHPWDKLAHLASYAVLSGLLRAAGLGSGWAFALAVLYGASDEWHQRFVPGRDASLADWVADTVGAGLGAWLSRRKRVSG